MVKRPFGSLAPAVFAALGGIVTGGCGLPDVFRSAGLQDIVISYVGDTLLATGDRVAPVVSVVAGGQPVPNPRLSFASSDNSVLAVTPIGDTLVACRSGHVQLTIHLFSSMVTDSAASAQDSIHVTGGPPLPTCP